MDILESLQGLTFEAKATIAIPLIVVVLIEIRREFAYREDRKHSARRDAADLFEKRAIIELERAHGQNSGAAMILGNVVHTGPDAGQHFTGVIRNAGPHLAEGIRVIASLGGTDARTIKAPKTLPPYSQPEPVDVMVPFGVFTYPDISAMLTAGESLDVRIDYVDGTPAPEPIYRCFVFRLEDVSGGTDWISHPKACFAPPEDPASHQA
jgi:hypothetical protein